MCQFLSAIRRKAAVRGAGICAAVVCLAGIAPAATAQTQGCPCEVNGDGRITSQDFFDFLGGFFAGEADVNGDGATTSQDFFDFLGCFFNAPPNCFNPDEPAIKGVNRMNLGANQILQIQGINLDGDRDDWCPLLMGNGGAIVPLQPLAAQGFQLVTAAGCAPPNTGVGQLMIERGRGVRGFVQLAFEDVEQLEPIWTWVPTGEGAVAGPDIVVNPTPPPPGEAWFLSGGPENGQLCLTLPREWPRDVKIRVQGRLRDANSEGADLDAYFIELHGQLTGLDVALRICDTISCAFAQRGIFGVVCQVKALPDGRAKITLRFGDRPVAWGCLNVCILDCEHPRIDDFFPLAVAVGDPLWVTGGAFLADPVDACVVIGDGPVRVPAGLHNYQNQTMQLEVGGIPEGVKEGAVMIGLGDGQLHMGLAASFPGNAFIDPAWSWVGQAGGPMAVAGAPVQLIGGGDGPTFTGTKVGNQMCVTITGTYAPGVKIRVRPRIHAEGTCGFGYDAQFDYCLVFDVNADGMIDHYDIAATIAVETDKVYDAHFGYDVTVVGIVTPVAGGTQVCIFVIDPMGCTLEWGIFTVEIL